MMSAARFSGLRQGIAAIVWWLASLAALHRPATDLQTFAIVALVLGNMSLGPTSRIVSGAAMPEQLDTLPDLDPITHGKLRPVLLSLLAGVEEAEFRWLREKTGALRMLEEARYIARKEKVHLAETNLALSAHFIRTQGPHWATSGRREHCSVEL